MTQRGIDPSTLSEAIRPNDDFFRYVNGPWLETHKIPDDRAADGAFYALHDEAEKQVRAIIEESPRDELTGALYASFMDTDKADALGAQPIEPDLATATSCICSSPVSGFPTRRSTARRGTPLCARSIFCTSRACRN